jgi:4-hydroxythreonine-4-phosphate dehydrogenase
MMVGITIGDPLGIGPEVILKSLNNLSKYRSELLIIGSEGAFSFWNNFYNLNNSFTSVNSIEQLEEKLNKGWDGFLLFDVGLKFEEGNYFRSSEIAIKSIDISVDFLNLGIITSVVNGPVSKEGISNVIGEFKGHTWYYAKSFNIKDYNMAFYSDDIKVVLVTEHVPLRDVFNLITEERLLSTINNTVNWVKRIYLGKKEFKIGICGINPHAGEDGKLGSDEKIIAEALSKVNDKSVKFFGPLPPDTAFLEYKKQKFDAVICMYHDQGLIPFKLLHFEDGIDVSLGFPFVRSTPDHGTAFGLVGKNFASHRSMLNAIKYNLMFNSNESITQE